LLLPAVVIDDILTKTIGTMGRARASASQLVVAAHQFGMNIECSGKALTQDSFEDYHGIMDENEGFVGFLLVCEPFNLSSNVSVGHFVALVHQPGEMIGCAASRMVRMVGGAATAIQLVATRGNETLLSTSNHARSL
jgi:hypothetical protein